MRDLEMAFLGKITASMTHEIKNTLAIFSSPRACSLTLITLSKDAAFPHQDKFQRVLGNINDQVHRSVDITTRLNQFAHSMDEPLAEVKVSDLLEQVVLLMRRLAKRQGIELKAEASDPDLSLTERPLPAPAGSGHRRRTPGPGPGTRGQDYPARRERPPEDHHPPRDRGPQEARLGRAGGGVA